MTQPGRQSGLAQRLHVLAAALVILLLVAGVPFLLIAIGAAPWKADLGELRSRAELIYRGKFQYRIFNDGARDVVPSYTQVNANFNLKPVGTKFTVGVTLTNIFNKAGIASRYSNPFGSFTTSDMYIPPRQFIGSVRYDF